MTPARAPRPARGAAVGPSVARRPGADLLALGAALAVLAALSALVGGGEVAAEGAGSPAVRAILLDRSASVTRGRPGWRRWALQALAEEGRAAALAGEEVALVTFARGAELRFGPEAAATFTSTLVAGGAADWLEPSREEELATDLEGAARVGLEAVSGEGRPRGSVTVLGDGRGGAGGAPSLLDPRLGRVEVVAPPPPALADVGVAALRLPARVEPGVRVPVRLELFLDGPLPGDSPAVTVAWELAFRSARRTVASRTLRGEASVPVPARLAAGAEHRTMAATVELPPLTPGTGELTVSVRPAGLPPGIPDTFPENDRARAALQVGDPVRALIVTPTPLPPRRPLGGPAFEGIDLEVIGPADLRARLLGPAPPQVVVTLDVPLSGLPGPALQRFVLGGGGWVRCAGWTALREEGALLQPLLALVPDREPRRPLDIAFLVDGSGSMGGVRWDRVRAALGAIVPTTAPRDRMELRFFTQVVSRPQLVFEGADGEGRSRSRNRSEAVKGLLQARIPGGSTDILYSLDGLAAAREGRSRVPEGGDPEERGLIVLITDGITNSVWGLRSKVRARIAAAGDRLVVVKVGTDELGGRFLDGLTLEGESVLEAGELEGLEDLLHQELQDVRLVEGGRVVAAAPGAAAPGAPAADWVAPLRAGVLEAAALDRPWVLERALRSRPAEDAVALLEVDLPLGAGERGTLVAVAERGEGTVAGVALPWLGLGDGAWSPTLSRRPAWLAPLLRTMALRAEAAREEEPPPRAWLSAGGELVVRGLPPGLPASLEARLTAAPSVDVFGGLGERAVVATVDLRAPAVDPAPDRVRVGPRPDALDRQPRGTELLLELPAPATALVVRADGPREAFPPAATALTRALGPAGPPSGAAVADGADDTQWPHPLTPLLLWGAAISLFLGALGGLRGLLGEARGAGSEAPGGQGSR